MIFQDHILLLAQIYRNHRGIGETSLALLIMNDRSFFSRVRYGRNNTIKTYHRITEWFSAHWPADLEWPSEIERPNINNGQGGLASEALPCTSGGNASPPANFNKKKESV